jgi:hypothetical protein
MISTHIVSVDGIDGSMITNKAPAGFDGKLEGKLV